MKNLEVPPVVIGLVVVVLVLLLGFGIYHYGQPAQPPGPPGGYTPGVPPWLDKNHPDLMKQYSQGAAPPPPGSPGAQALAAETPPAAYAKPK